MRKNKLQAIFWDFDGVLMNSNKVRDLGFLEVLKEFPQDQVDALMLFHQQNGGLSRYVKFRYFFEEIRGESITDEAILVWAERFSILMKQFLTDRELLIKETMDFVQSYHQKIPMHVVSGSDQVELRYLCRSMGIDPYFKSIHGSPKPKTQWVGELIKEYDYVPSSCILIGDSINDFEAAKDNGLYFMGYNNKKVESLSTKKIQLN
ncbi:MAG: HAD family hydrolase [Lutimonas sp.]